MCAKTINIVDREKSYDAISRGAVAVGSNRSGDRTVKEETKTSSSSIKKSQEKGEEPMEWNADTKDVLQQLLRDDVIYFVLLSLVLQKPSSIFKRFLLCTIHKNPWCLW